MHYPQKDIYCDTQRQSPLGSDSNTWRLTGTPATRPSGSRGRKLREVERRDIYPNKGEGIVQPQGKKEKKIFCIVYTYIGTPRGLEPVIHRPGRIHGSSLT